MIGIGMDEKNMVFDARPSARSLDENGFLHVAVSHITKATVNPYYGREIPGWRERGLDPDAVYYGFRDPEELKKSIPTWRGLPLHIEHHIDSADEPAKLTRVGAVGAAAWNAPYVDASLAVWDRKAIDAIENGSFRELSCAYRYDPDFTPGVYEGVEYDFIMRNIRGNHVALVEEGRAGPDVVVADAALSGAMDDRWITVKPNGPDKPGRPALIDENGVVKAGMGGKFNGRNIDDIPRGKNPHAVTEEKYQARQQRQAQKQKGSSSPLDVSKLSDQEIDDRMSSIGGAWHRATDAEKEEYYAIKRELDKRRKEKNAELDRKRDERRASPEYQAELKRREEAAARRDHVREREREITSSTYERAQAKLHKPFDDRLKRQLGYSGSAANNNATHPDLDALLVQRANGMSALGQSGDYTKREYQSYVERINQLNLSEAEKKKAIAGIHKKLTERLEAEASVASPVASGRARLDVRSIQKSADKASQKSAEAKAIFEKAQSAAHKADATATKRTREEALAHAYKNGELEAFVGNERWYRANRRSGTWRQDVNYKEQAHDDAAFEEGEHPEKRQKKGHPASGVGNKPAVGGSAWLLEREGIAHDGDQTTFKTGTIQNTGQQTAKRGGFMSRFKRWFRGAFDDAPGIEKKEVDLAQAIIDLHKVDPETGEIVDITEDEDKAAEIRKLVGELSSKLDPDEVKRLTDALSDLAYSPATGDEDPDGKETMDEDMKKAMDACGLDSDDEYASNAFAEGVKYGESLEKDPAERARLDREHESEGMKKAMDSCGLDAENPAEARAFAEGVKYGERKEKEEPRKLDSLHEARGMKRAMGRDEDKNAAIERILGSVPGLTPEQKAKLADALQDLAYSPATGDEDPDEAKTAQDRALRRRGPRPLTAMDAARIKASAVAEAQEHMRGLSRAVRDVRGLVGELDPLSFDSASDVYGYALEQSGINPREYPRQAWRGMVDVMRVKKAAALSGGMARDAAPIKMNGKFAGLNNISIAD